MLPHDCLALPRRPFTVPTRGWGCVGGFWPWLGGFVGRFTGPSPPLGRGWAPVFQEASHLVVAEAFHKNRIMGSLWLGGRAVSVYPTAKPCVPGPVVYELSPPPTTAFVRTILLHHKKSRTAKPICRSTCPPPPPGLSERAAPGTSPHGTAGMDPIEYRPSEKHGPHPIAMGAVPLPATSGARASPAPVATTMPIAPRSGPGVAGSVPVPRPLPPALSSTAVVTTRVASKPSATPAVPAPAVSTAAPAPPRAALLAPNTAAVSAVRAGRPPHALPGNEPPSGPKRAPTLPLPAAKVPRVGAESAPQQRRATQQAPARTAKLVVTHEQWMRYDCTVQQHVTDQTGRFSEDWVCFHERLKKCHNPV